MKKSIIIILTVLIVFLINNCFSQETQHQPNNRPDLKDESLIKLLDTNNIDRILNHGNSVWLLKFYAPWCKHSQEFQKTFVEMSHLLKDHLNFGSVDCINDPMLLHRFEITAYPTLKFLYNGQLFEFQGERTIEHIVQFLQSGYKDVVAMPYPLIDQQEILKRQLELQYSREGMTPEQIEQVERQIKEKQQEYENKRNARKYLEVEHDHDEEREIAEYNERINKKLNNNNNNIDQVLENEPKVPGNSTVESTSHSMLESILDSKLAYLLFGSISTGLFFIIKKKISKKSKFMKIA
ncbi:hypothetical protein RB653_009951 [Dictyostelium firmibasis]|uniref:Thioredoxin domain-containing protein n=1 Tax=Dictyostelium firmibasis TaxID=79012 RepID=A0AAN7U088_9MYCE